MWRTHSTIFGQDEVTDDLTAAQAVQIVATYHRSNPEDFYAENGAQKVTWSDEEDWIHVETI